VNIAKQINLEDPEEQMGAQMLRQSAIQTGDTDLAWFSSVDNTRLLQLQDDMLLLNWRKTGSSATYPRFNELEPEFWRAWTVLEGVADDPLVPGLTANGASIADVSTRGGLTEEGAVFEFSEVASLPDRIEHCTAMVATPMEEPASIGSAHASI